MTQDNQQQWGEVPGSVGIEVVRNFTFYNF